MRCYVAYTRNTIILLTSSVMLRSITEGWIACTLSSPLMVK
nr:MAG TPA: hypothetical protein [Caudoviricetes sp.]